MTREERLKFCQICTHQKISYKQGIICRLTNNIADFEVSCDNYQEDTGLKNSLERIKIGVEANIASQSTRFANYILDSIFIFITGFIFITFFTFILRHLSLITFIKFSLKSKLYGRLIYLGIMILYYITCEVLYSRTIAKVITRTKVVTLKGDKPNLKAILIRTLCRFIPFEPFSYLASSNTGWHDELSKTRVINASTNAR